MANERRIIPAPAVDLYTRFIHGEIGRRAIMRGVSRYTSEG